MMRIVTEAFVYSLGLGLGLLVGSMTIASRVHLVPRCLCRALIA